MGVVVHILTMFFELHLGQHIARVLNDTFLFDHYHASLPNIFPFLSTKEF
jgi:hypothetical protein